MSFLVLSQIALVHSLRLSSLMSLIRACVTTNPHPPTHPRPETVDALIMAIHNYEGGVLMVSHDQHLLSSCVEQFWAVSERKVRFFDTFDAAKAFSLERIQHQANNPAALALKRK